jgi:hypothetical protein
MHLATAACTTLTPKTDNEHVASDQVSRVFYFAALVAATKAASTLL